MSDYKASDLLRVAAIAKDGMVLTAGETISLLMKLETENAEIEAQLQEAIRKRDQWNDRYVEALKDCGAARRQLQEARALVNSKGKVLLPNQSDQDRFYCLGYNAAVNEIRLAIDAAMEVGDE